MKYQAVIYYPSLEKDLNFTKAKFLEIFDRFDELGMVYVNDEKNFYRQIENADFIMALKIRPDVYRYAKKLQAVFTCMAGKEVIPVCENKKITCYYGSFHGKLIRESVLSAMLYFNQNFPLICQCAEKGIWAEAALFGKRRPISQQSVLIIGFGTIGRYCAEYLARLNIKVYAAQRTHHLGICHDSNAEYVHIDDLHRVLPTVDHVVSFLPRTEATNNMFDRQFFKKMANHAYFYNFGRGNAVVEADLISALDSNEIAGALLDVFKQEPLEKTSPLWSAKNIVITSHICAYYDNYFDEYARELTTQLQRELVRLKAEN